MTHTLHRLGSRENLQDDFVILAMSSRNVNDKGSHKALRHFFELALELEPVNAGDVKTGNIFTHSHEEILAAIQDNSVVHAVFTENNKVVELLKRVHDADLGISIVVSGLFDQVYKDAREAGLYQHTIQCSLGVWGQVNKLPDAEELELTTMCGHGQIAPSRVKRLAREVRLGRLTKDEAAIELAKNCVCGVFNPVRAARLLESLAKDCAQDKPRKRIIAGQTEI